jgi:hypothetical protein
MRIATLDERVSPGVRRGANALWFSGGQLNGTELADALSAVHATPGGEVALADGRRANDWQRQLIWVMRGPMSVADAVTGGASYRSRFGIELGVVRAKARENERCRLEHLDAGRGGPSVEVAFSMFGN